MREDIVSAAAEAVEIAKADVSKHLRFRVWGSPRGLRCRVQDPSLRLQYLRLRFGVWV